MVVGAGSEVTNPSTVQGRTKRELISQIVALSLVNIAIEENDNEAEKRYWNTYHCQTQIVSDQGRVYGVYCKNRICTLCMSIRKAMVMNKYLPVMNEWESPQFVTLTIRACRANKLEYYMDRMLKGFKKIIDRNKKRHRRGTGMRLIGIKSLECNFNPIKKTYNPHFHLVVATKEMAEIILSDWLQMLTPKYANRLGQCIRSVEDKEKALIELVKYGSKIFTEPDLKKPNTKGTKKFYARALYNILQAFSGHRIFDRFGFNLPKSLETKTNEDNIKLLRSYERWTFTSSHANWVNDISFETLTDYALPMELAEMLAFHVDTSTM